MGLIVGDYFVDISVTSLSGMVGFSLCIEYRQPLRKLFQVFVQKRLSTGDRVESCKDHTSFPEK